jgi:hypothetical protein
LQNIGVRYRRFLSGLVAEGERIIPAIGIGAAGLHEFRYSTFSARRVNERAGKRGVLWQRGYYEHVIRNEKALAPVRRLPEFPLLWLGCFQAAGAAFRP